MTGNGPHGQDIPPTAGDPAQQSDRGRQKDADDIREERAEDLMTRRTTIREGAGPGEVEARSVPVSEIREDEHTRLDAGHYIDGGDTDGE